MPNLSSIGGQQPKSAEVPLDPLPFVELGQQQVAAAAAALPVTPLQLHKHNENNNNNNNDNDDNNKNRDVNAALSPRFQDGDEAQFAVIRSPRQKRADAKEELEHQEQQKHHHHHHKQQHHQHINNSNNNTNNGEQEQSPTPDTASTATAMSKSASSDTATTWPGSRQARVIAQQENATTNSLEEDVEVLRQRVNEIQAHILHLKAPSRDASHAIVMTRVASPSPPGSAGVSPRTPMLQWSPAPHLPARWKTLDMRALANNGSFDILREYRIRVQALALHGLSTVVFFLIQQQKAQSQSARFVDESDAVLYATRVEARRLVIAGEGIVHASQPTQFDASMGDGGTFTVVWIQQRNDTSTRTVAVILFNTVVLC
jgi:hypothetical protein